MNSLGTRAESGDLGAGLLTLRDGDGPFEWKTDVEIVPRLAGLATWKKDHVPGRQDYDLHIISCSKSETAQNPRLLDSLGETTSRVLVSRLPGEELPKWAPRDRITLKSCPAPRRNLFVMLVRHSLVLHFGITCNSSDDIVPSP